MKIKKIIARKLKAQQEQEMERARSLSSHVSTRCYRAPEISMIERYDQAVDMWSLGCVLYEILHTVLESKEESLANEKNKYRHVLYNGISCYPLSPNPDAKSGQKCI